jgi:integrase/recombinase XerD
MSHVLVASIGIQRVGEQPTAPVAPVTPADHTERFIQERRYLKSVTPKTESWYRQAFHAFDGALTNKASIGGRNTELRKRGVSATSVNTWLRVLNAYSRWSHTEGLVTELIHVPRLEEEQKVLATLRPEQIQKLVRFKPEERGQYRIHTLAILLIDSGMRIDEALSLRREDVDLDNLLLKIHGKGQRERIVPISTECRKVLWKFIGKTSGAQSALVFCTRDGRKLLQRNTLREFHALGAKLQIAGVRFSFHTMRHTFAVNYIRNGGDVFRLQRILGHASLEMTRRYVNLQTSDLSAVHERLSVLGNRKV